MLDALADHRVEPDDPTRTVPNPIRRALDKEAKAARAEVATLEQTYGAAAADNPEGKRPSMRGFKIAHSATGKELSAARARLAEVLVRRHTIPKRVEVREVNTGAVIKLATERKHLTNIIKMVAYQAEGDLYALLGPHYARNSDEGRTLLHELLAGAGDITVASGELRVTMHPLSAPHRTLAVQALCQKLSAVETVFPGTALKLRFAIQPRPEIGLAFPGPRPPRARRAGPAQA